MQFYEALAKASPLSISAEKVRFENWVKSEGYRIVEEDKDYPYRYSTDEIEGMWQAWQAAQSSPATPASQERAGAGKDAALTDEQILDAIAKVCAFDRVLASSGGELKHFLSPVQS
jgi:hypothetical protein